MQDVPGSIREDEPHGSTGATAETAPQRQRKGILDPIDRLSEILFGLLVVLTFTGSLSVATAERSDVHDMLIGAIGANIAWGLIDATMYLLASMSERGTSLRILRAIRRAPSASASHEAIRSMLPEAVAAELRHDDIERIRSRVLKVDPRKAGGRLQPGDFWAAAMVFLIVVASTFPPIVPCVVLDDAHLAMRLSNGIAIAMLAMIGFGYGKVSGISPWWMAGAMVVLGSFLVWLTIALGG